MSNQVIVKQPKVFTIVIYSVSRSSGNSSADYYVNLPQIDALVNGHGKPDYYELYLDRICGTLIAATPDESVAVGNTTGFVEVGLDFVSPFLITNGRPQVKFIVPVTGANNAYMLDGSARTMNPVLVSATGFNSLLHIQMYNDQGTLINAGTHEHAIVLTLKERL